MANSEIRTVKDLEERNSRVIGLLQEGLFTEDQAMAELVDTRSPAESEAAFRRFEGGEADTVREFLQKIKSFEEQGTSREDIRNTISSTAFMTSVLGDPEEEEKAFDTQKRYVEGIATDGFKQEAAQQIRAAQEEDSLLDETLATLSEIPMAVVGGFRDAMQASVDFASHISEPIIKPLAGAIQEGTAKVLESVGATEKAKQTRSIKGVGKEAGRLPEIEKPKSGVAGFTRSISQFLLPFTQFSRSFKALGVIKGSIAADAATGLVSFDEHEGLLLNMLDDTDIKKAFPEFVQTTIDTLKRDPTDSFAEGRLKNAIEAASLGVASESLFLGIKYIWKGRATKNIVLEGKEASKKSVKKINKISELIGGIQKGQKVELGKLLGKKKLLKAEEGVSDKAKKKLAEQIGVTEENITKRLDEGGFRVRKETISIKDQAATARPLPILEKELREGGVFQAIRSQKIQDKLNKVTLLEDEGFAQLQKSLLSYSKRVEVEDLTAGDDFINNELISFLELDAAAKDVFQDVARSMGFRGQSVAVRTANQIQGLFKEANSKTKLDLVKAMTGLIENAGDIDTFMRNAGKEAAKPAGGRAVLDAVNSWYINGLLSSPKTLVMDTLSNPLWNSWLVAERGVSAAVGKVRKGALKLIPTDVRDRMNSGFFQNTSDAVVFKEVTSLVDGQASAIADGLKYAVKAMAGQTRRAKAFRAINGKGLSKVKDLTSELKQKRLDTQTRFDTPIRQRAISAEALSVDNTTK